MAMKQLSKEDTKAIKAYEDQLGEHAANANFVDRTNLLLDQMTFIALNNKNFFKF